jgi:hypothetical protein
MAYHVNECKWGRTWFFTTTVETIFFHVKKICRKICCAPLRRKRILQTHWSSETLFSVSKWVTSRTARAADAPQVEILPTIPRKIPRHLEHAGRKRRIPILSCLRWRKIVSLRARLSKTSIQKKLIQKNLKILGNKSSAKWRFNCGADLRKKKLPTANWCICICRNCLNSEENNALVTNYVRTIFIFWWESFLVSHRIEKWKCCNSLTPWSRTSILKLFIL